MLNFAQVHLLFNHLPVVGGLFACCTLIAGVVMRNGIVRRTGMALMVAAALFTAPAFFSGEPAEDVLKTAVPPSDTTKHIIHEHEEAAEGAAVVMVIAGLAAAMGLWFSRHHTGHRLETRATIAALILGMMAFALMARAAHMGGLIRHEEIRPVVAPLT